MRSSATLRPRTAIPPHSGARVSPVPARRARLTRYEGGACLLIGAAVALHLWLIDRGLPPFDSDEGTMGVMALHINGHGARPVFLYGQGYMGSLEAYLAAGIFRVAGASDLTLRLGLVLLAALFLGIMYLLAALLYSRRVALLSLPFLAVGSSELLTRQLKADGGYSELLVFGAAAMLLACYLGLSAVDAPRPASGRRLAAYGGWGLIVGLGIWSHPLMLPFAAMSGLLLLLTCRRELRGLAGVCGLLGIVIGLFPVLAYNVSAAPGQSTVATIVAIVRAGGSGHTSAGPAPFVQRLAGTVAVSIPVATGGSGLCGLRPQDAWPLSAATSRHTVLCTAIHATWGAGWLLCWFLAVLGAVRSIVQRRQGKGRGRSETRDDRYLENQQVARLALLGTAGLTLALFMLSPAPAHAPWFNVRYLEGVWVALPAILALFATDRLLPAGRRWFAAYAVKYGALGLLATALLSDTIGAYRDAGYPTWLHGQLMAAASDLTGHHVNHVYTDYWTCDWLAFETHERITCAVLDSQLRPSLDRYLPYRAAVQRDRRAWYLFRVDTPQAATFARLAGASGRYRRTDLAAFTLYQPLGTRSNTSPPMLNRTGMLDSSNSKRAHSPRNGPSATRNACSITHSSGYSRPVWREMVTRRPSRTITSCPAWPA